jgi:hypothetical protein
LIDSAPYSDGILRAGSAIGVTFTAGKKWIGVVQVFCHEIWGAYSAK